MAKLKVDTKCCEDRSLWMVVVVLQEVQTRETKVIDWVQNPGLQSSSH